MEVVIDNNEFCIRLYQNVAYLKVTGIQDESGADFFEKTVDEVIEEYSHDRFAALCDLTELILPEPSVSKQVNNAILKLSSRINVECIAIIMQPKFLQIIQAYLFSFYLKNISVKTKIFQDKDKAIDWLTDFGYQLTEIESFLKIKEKAD
ncbi:STAS/SEC14 domain-containing protein [Labilibaculum sp.]|uniref:DUF7793 family protein n=1 Tax=Labilibaculum sp. TaxID=2060723 RepID=UPI003561AFF1